MQVTRTSTGTLVLVPDSTRERELLRKLASTLCFLNSELLLPTLPIERLSLRTKKTLLARLLQSPSRGNCSVHSPAIRFRPAGLKRTLRRLETSIARHPIGRR